MLDQVALAQRLRRLLLTVFLIALIAAPIVAWFAYPPTRVLVPALAPITCGEARVCVDDITKLPQAQALYDDALAFVNANVGQIKSAPMMYFCASQACSDHFGWDGVAGYNIGVFGAVLKPDWWAPFIVRHELIHHLQNERFGMLNYIRTKPEWLLEGMAYALSGDPRPMFGPDQALKAGRDRFNIWYNGIAPETLWEEAAKVSR
jgi:hypothetical protein